MRIKDKIRALRLSHLILSLGWERAKQHLDKLSPDKKKDYFTPKSETKK